MAKEEGNVITGMQDSNVVCLRGEVGHTAPTLTGMGGDNGTCLGKKFGEEADNGVHIVSEPTGMEDVWKMAISQLINRREGACQIIAGV